MKKKFFGTASKGKLVLDEHEDFLRTVCLLEGKDIEVTIDRKRKTRSNQQNKYFHGVIVPLISGATGYEKDEVKEMIRAKFLSYDLKVGDEIVKVGRSTASLGTIEFELLNADCRRWASKTLGIYIPDPNSVAL